MEDGITRRTVLGASAAALAGTGLAVGSAAQEQGNGQAPPDYGGWLDGVGNYDGTTVDRTGQAAVTVTVAAEGNGGNYAFDPPAVRVDNGATVRWEWTGEGGAHSVVSADDGPLDSGEVVGDAGAQYQHTFESDGIYRYRCQPHEGLGMKGAVVVGTDYPTRAPATPEPTPTPEQTAADEPTQSPEQTAADESTQSPEQTAADEPTQSPEATETPQSTPSGRATGGSGSGFTAVTVALGLAGAAGWRQWRRDDRQ